MKKYFKYIMILIIGLFVFNGINVKAENAVQGAGAEGVVQRNLAKDVPLCGYKTVKDGLLWDKEVTVTLFWNNVTNQYFVSSSKSTQSDNYSSLNKLFKEHSTSSYSLDKKNFRCPAKIEYKGRNDFTFSGGTSSSSLKYSIIKEMNSYPTKFEKWYTGVKCQDIIEKYNNLAGNTDTSYYKVNPNVEEQFNITSSSGYDMKKKTGEKVTINSLFATACSSAQSGVYSVIETKLNSCKSEFDKIKENNNAEVGEKIDKIVDQVEEQTNPEYKAKRIVVKKSEDTSSCSAMLGDEATKFIQKLLKFVQYGGVIIALLASTLDFVKAVSSGSNDDLKKATNKFMKRMIFAALLFFAALLTKIVLDIFGITVSADCLIGD